MLKLMVFSLLFSIVAQAAPRLDTAIGTPDPNIITVVPDSVDTNLYYLFPQRFGIASEPSGRSRFLYQEYRDGLFSTMAVVEMVFTPLFDKELVDTKVKAIRAQNPNAKFAFVTVLSSKVDVPTILFPAIELSDCRIVGMAIGQDIVCHQKVKDNGRDLYIERFRSGLLNVFQLNYRFVASVNGQPFTADHSIAMYGGGISDRSYYLDRKGRPLNLPNAEKNGTKKPLMSFELENLEEQRWLNKSEAREYWNL